MHHDLVKKYIGWLFKAMSILLFGMVCSCKETEVTKNKIIVVHARGLTYLEMSEYLKSTSSGSFFEQKASNGFIKKLHPITNAVTISNIASFETGVTPAKHGIIGHLFGVSKNDSISITSGFAQRFDVETFWEKADLAGKKVLKVGALTLHGKYEKHSNVDCLAQGAQIGNAQILQLTPEKGNQEEKKVKYRDLAGNFTFQLQKDYFDSVVVYKLKQASGGDQWVLDKDYNFDNGFYAKLKSGEWFELENKQADEARQSFRGKLTLLLNDTLELYVRPAYKNRGYPANFVKNVDLHLGASRGWPNIPFYASNKINARTLVEEMNEEMDYVINSFSLAIKENEYDLIMIDYPLMDRLNHAFLNKKAASKEIKQYYKRTYNRMDKDFKLIEDYAKQNGYELIITSGHGFSAVHTSIDINKFLKKSKIKTYSKSGNWEVIAVPGKVSAHIYVNQQLNLNEKKVVLNKIEEAFKKLRQPEKQTPIVDRVYKKGELSKIGLSHKNAGDLYVLLNPGYVFGNNSSEEDGFWGIPTFKGDHGYSLKHEASYAVLIANDNCKTCRSIDVAKMIEQKLKLH